MELQTGMRSAGAWDFQKDYEKEMLRAEKSDVTSGQGLAKVMAAKWEAK